MAETYPNIQVLFDGAVAQLTLNHPPVNVIDFPTITELKRALTRLREEPRLCAIVLRGAGRVFSAGVDIPSHLPATVHQMIREFHEVFEMLDHLAAPTVALVDGACLGGACELVGYMDYVIATRNARFGVPEIRLGVFPPAAAAFFPARFGHQFAMRLLTTGETVDAEVALRAGLASQIVDAARIDEALVEVLAPLRELSASSLRMVKRATIQSRGSFRELVAPSERVYLDALMATRDAVEGLDAFIEKRDPVWVHG